jgi:glycosyltransferase involved in cell wall biosynthesis
MCRRDSLGGFADRPASLGDTRLDTSFPLVSVITPVLNSASTLELTLASVAAQTYPNIEHIVIDGGSTDGTIDVLRRFRSPVPLRWLTGEDAGMYAAINRGLGLAQGEFLSYLNGDDLYLPWSVRRAVSALASGGDLAFGDVLVLSKEGGLSRRLGIQFYPRFRPQTYAYRSMGQPSVFWRRKVSDIVGGFDEQMHYGGDFEYWLRTGTSGFRFTHVREVLAVEVGHEGTLSTVHADELRREIERTRARYAATVILHDFRRVRALMQLIHWRSQVLMWRFNLKRDSPSSWPDLIHFLRSAGLKPDGSPAAALLLPLPLPKSWHMWRLDPVEFERRLTEELWSRRATDSEEF